MTMVDTFIQNSACYDETSSDNIWIGVKYETGWIPGKRFKIKENIIQKFQESFQYIKLYHFRREIVTDLRCTKYCTEFDLA